MFHLHVRYCSRDGGRSCDAAREYIAREGRYEKRGDAVRWVRSLHMPEWVEGASAPAYWSAAEGRHSRANARTALLVEFALPKQLSDEDSGSADRIALLPARYAPTARPSRRAARWPFSCSRLRRARVA
jgi:hypothetical protein